MKKVDDDDNGEISEPEDPLMLQRDAKDWKVGILPHLCAMTATAVSLKFPIEFVQIGTSGPLLH